MNKDKYLTVSIKQKKAIKDKGKGTTLTAYNKKAEIANSSGKKYIEEFYNNPGKLHRLEVHLNNDEVKEYLNRTKQELSFYSLIDNRFLYDLFDQTLNILNSKVNMYIKDGRDRDEVALFLDLSKEIMRNTALE